ncbi:MAG: hypothetical protein Q8K99_06795 [Actinomycetota bacterium]|nr:hypothetical protein [Actinomycetota bacterium]
MDQNPAGAPPVTPEKRGFSPWIIVAVVLLVLLMCGILGTFAACALFVARSSSDSATEAPVEAIAPAPNAADNVDLAEVDRMLRHFYPGLEATEFATIEGAEDWAAFRVIARSDAVPEFRFAILADRSISGDIEGAGDAAMSYVDEASGATWVHAGTGPSGLKAFVGGDGIMGGSTAVKIMKDFAAAHPNLYCTDFEYNSNVDCALAGINAEDLAGWYEDYTTWAASFHLDLRAGVWEETGFTEESAP